LQNSQYVRLLQARQVQHCRPQMVHFDFGVIGCLPPLSPSKIRRGRGGATPLRAREEIALAHVPQRMPTVSSAASVR
jgi:hypothetical protein